MGFIWPRAGLACTKDGAPALWARTRKDVAVSGKLTDPALPAGAIIKVGEDGDAIRNDGVYLRAANKNPWYVLATIYGEQEEGAPQYNRDKTLAAKNRRAWNLWACQDLTDEGRADRARKVGLKAADLAPLPDAEKAAAEWLEITELFQRRMGIGAEPPPNHESINFSETIFSRFLCFAQMVFEKNVDFASATFMSEASFISAMFAGSADFRSATFMDRAYSRFATFTDRADFRSAMFTDYADFLSAVFTGDAAFRSAAFTGDAVFISATFTGDADFRSATFTRYANFRSAKFVVDADFGSAMFTRYADFRSVTFTDDATFRSATFAGFANFSSVMFTGPANYSSAKFKAATRFVDARFRKAVPQFHAAALYDDTVFTLPDNYRKNWPPLKGDGVMPAADQKRAYNRLRLFMNRSLQIDEEQFFHRQEMRCKMALADCPHRPFYWLYSGLSDFGISVVRPIVGICVVIAAGVVCMLCWQGAFSFTAAGWSISNTLPFLGFGRLYYGADFAAHLPVWLKVLGGVQTIFSYTLLFFLGLGLRNRFRLR